MVVFTLKRKNISLHSPAILTSLSLVCSGKGQGLFFYAKVFAQCSRFYYGTHSIRLYK